MGDQYKFGDAPGLPAVEHAKRRAREKKLKSGEQKKIFYTLIDSKKIIMLTVKPNGLYRSYFGNAKKMGTDLVEIQKKKWKEAGQWIEQGQIDEITGPLIKKMQGEL